MKPGRSWAEIPEYNAIPALFHISLTEGSHDIPIEEFLLMTLIPVNGAAFLPVLVPGNILLRFFENDGHTCVRCVMLSEICALFAF
jgi:hypothetical protein